TAVTATVPAGWDALHLAELLHPTAAVGGTPTDAAVRVIEELEGMDRGRYAGPGGWMDGRGDGEFAIALRCAERSGARARWCAGDAAPAGWDGWAGGATASSPSPCAVPNCPAPGGGCSPGRGSWRARCLRRSSTRPGSSWGR